MIQRIQSLHLLFSALCAGLLFLFPLWEAHLNMTGMEGKVQEFTIMHNSILIMTTVVAALIPLIAIFFHHKRTLQKRLAWITIVVILLLYGLIYYYSKQFDSPLAEMFEVSFKVGLLLPFFSIVFILLAIQGIRKDEKLLQSMDRLR